MPAFTLSAVIITYQEEKNIRRCLDSLRGLADEIIVVDSFSTDKTKEICIEQGVRFFQFPWDGFSAAKNHGNKQAIGDYILSIDADEALSDRLKQSLLREKENPHAEVYSFHRLTNYCGQWIRHGGWYPDVKIRIFKRGLAHWVGEVHEELFFSTLIKPMSIHGDLLHYSYPTVESHLLKSLTYASLIAARDFAHGKKKNVLLHGILKPSSFFVKQYVLRLGFLDGYYGFVIAVISGLEKFMRFATFRELSKNSK
jgi:glycosyltransferase involved in cell wall biosynthesis